MKRMMVGLLLLTVAANAFAYYMPVITSYSIHYTKLYDRRRGKFGCTSSQESDGVQIRR